MTSFPVEMQKTIVGYVVVNFEVACVDSEIISKKLFPDPEVGRRAGGISAICS